MINKPKISILLPAYKAEKLLEQVFIPSLKHCSIPCEVIIYDNDGNGDYLDFLTTIQELRWKKPEKYSGHITYRVIGDGKNIGLNAGLNECAKAASGDYFYLCHTDMSLLPGWDTALLKAAKNQPPGKQLLCSRSVEPTKGHTDFHIIKNYGMEWDEFDENKLLEDFKEYSNNTIVSGYRMPFFMHRRLWDKMGGVDSTYFSYCTDDDLVQTAYDVGVRQFWMVYDSLVYHLQGKSNQQQTVDRDSNEPYNYFVDKWKKKGYVDAQHPGQWHSQLIPWYNKVR